MKKILALLLALMLALSLAACGGNDDPDPSGSGTTNPGTNQPEQTSDNTQPTNGLSDETTNTVSGEVEGDPAGNGENGLDESSFQWKDNELTASVPKPGFGVLTGSILMPNNASYTAKVAEITDEQAADYLTQAQNADWNGEKSEQDGGYLYNAAASDGRTMELNYNRGLLVITIKPAN